MAEIFPDEGIDYIHAIFPKNGANIATLYCGLFTSQTASTVPARSATGGAAPAGWTEATFTGYARQSIAAASWGAQTTDGSGRKTTAGQVTFPAAGSAQTVNGFFIATHPSSQAGDTMIFFANFDDLTANALTVNDVQKVTPTMKADG